MPIEARYHEQVRLLVSLLPFLNDEQCFALKGGTAINLFVQPLPRLSVDIDLDYLPLKPLDEALRRCREGRCSEWQRPSVLGCQECELSFRIIAETS